MGQCQISSTFWELSTKLKIETMAMTVRMKQGQPESAIENKNKLTSATLTVIVKEVEYWKYPQKWHFQNDCLRKNWRRLNT